MNIAKLCPNDDREFAVAAIRSYEYDVMRRGMRADINRRTKEWKAALAEAPINQPPTGRDFGGFITRLTPVDIKTKAKRGGVTVHSFGAKGDGTTDDTAAFQAAMNFASLSPIFDLEEMDTEGSVQ